MICEKFHGLSSTSVSARKKKKSLGHMKVESETKTYKDDPLRTSSSTRSNYLTPGTKSSSIAEESRGMMPGFMAHLGMRMTSTSKLGEPERTETFDFHQAWWKEEWRANRARTTAVVITSEKDGGRVHGGGSGDVRSGMNSTSLNGEQGNRGPEVEENTDRQTFENIGVRGRWERRGLTTTNGFEAKEEKKSDQFYTFISATELGGSAKCLKLIRLAFLPNHSNSFFFTPIETFIDRKPGCNAYEP
ncbi:hypothetical protein DL96DRAFT_1684261 [Flagelloscypha sp. PMI_526]|nr:hypothetical protein DL96DRAFT_1684261 [Flagelloscypha sp. PMI_526]